MKPSCARPKAEPRQDLVAQKSRYEQCHVKEKALRAEAQGPRTKVFLIFQTSYLCFYFNIIICIIFQSLRGTLESVERERQKAIRDLSATNQRVAVFAQGLNNNKQLLSQNYLKARSFYV
jgi:hypothetical protein